MQIDVHGQSRVSRGTRRAVTYMWLFAPPRHISCHIREILRAVGVKSRNYVPTNWLVITIEYRTKLMESKGRLQKRFLIKRIIISSTKTYKFHHLFLYSEEGNIHNKLHYYADCSNSKANRCNFLFIEDITCFLETILIDLINYILFTNL